jgi:hypothetical protein
MSHLRLIVGRFLIVAAAIVCGVASALDTAAHAITLPGHGSLTLAFPDSWEQQIRQPANGAPLTIRLSPRTGPAFTILITTIWESGPTAKATEAQTVQTMVADAAKSAASQAVEQSLPLREIVGADGRGLYFSATDRAPKPGEFKFITKGMLPSGDIVLAFTILTNDGQGAVVESALETLRAAVH